MVNKARKTSVRTIKASEANELLCENNIVKTHHVNRSIGQSVGNNNNNNKTFIRDSATMKEWCYQRGPVYN